MMAANYFSRLLLSLAFSLRTFFNIQSQGKKKCKNGCDYNIQQWREIEEIENAITKQRENFNNTYKDEEKVLQKRSFRNNWKVRCHRVDRFSYLIKNIFFKIHHIKNICMISFFIIDDVVHKEKLVNKEKYQSWAEEKNVIK